MEINITWNICRVCLVEEQKKPQVAGGAMEPLRHLFDEDKQLAKQIFECSGIMMKPNDSLPEKICKNCLTMVKYAVNFRKTCRASDTYLQALLQRTRATSLLFNPERTPSIYLEDDGDNNESELIAAEPEDVVKQLQTLKRNGVHLEKSPKKLRKETNCPEINSNTDDLIAHVEEEQEEVRANDLNDMVEMEEILEHSEPDEKQMFNAERHDSSLGEQREQHSDKQDFQTNEVTTKDHDDLDEEIRESDAQDIRHNNKDFYCLVGNIKNENILQTEANLEHEDQIEIVDQEDDNVQFISIDEEEEEVKLQDHLETDNDDSQAQVSSTVVTREEFMELQQQNYNLSNDANSLPTEYIVDEYLIDDSNSSTSLQNSSVVVVNSTPDKKRAVVVYPERKTKIEVSKPVATGSSNTISSVAASQQQTWACDICGNNFTTRHILNAHIKVHRQEKNHECELCLKRFITACNLQAHMRIHTGEKPFECQYCGRRFSDRSSNLRHERIHTNEKPFQCNDCGKSFSLSTTLKKHLKVHTGERSYRCELCAKSFKLPHQLKAHKNTTLHKAVEQLGVLENE